jgi:hypothetical protein
MQTGVGYSSAIGLEGVRWYENLFNVVRSQNYGRLQALTHSVWWTDEVLPARMRLRTCIDESARALAESYEDFVARYGRAEVV